MNRSSIQEWQACVQWPLGILTGVIELWTLYWLLHAASLSQYIYGLIDIITGLGLCWLGLWLNSDTKCDISIENKLEF